MNFDAFSVSKIVDAECNLNNGFFPCKNKEDCIPAEHVCNNLSQCRDHSDEGEACTDRKFEYQVEIFLVSFI